MFKVQKWEINYSCTWSLPIQPESSQTTLSNVLKISLPRHYLARTAYHIIIININFISCACRYALLTENDWISLDSQYLRYISFIYNDFCQNVLNNDLCYYLFFTKYSAVWIGVTNLIATISLASNIFKLSTKQQILQSFLQSYIIPTFYT